MKIRSIVSIAQILPNLHEFQHDRFFVPATSSGPSVYPNQGFFHAPVLNCSASAGSGSAGRALRREEDSLFRHREGGEADRHGYSRRDFFALCRGERIVSAIFFCTVSSGQSQKPKTDADGLCSTPIH